MSEATEAQFEETLALYVAMNEAYGQLPEGVFESEATRQADEAYELALATYDIFDSAIVDEAYSRS